MTGAMVGSAIVAVTILIAALVLLAVAADWWRERRREERWRAIWGEVARRRLCSCGRPATHVYTVRRQDGRETRTNVCALLAASLVVGEPGSRLERIE